MSIDLLRLLPTSLKKPTVQQNIASGALQMMGRTRYRLCRSPEMQSNPHAFSRPLPSEYTELKISASQRFDKFPESISLYLVCPAKLTRSWIFIEGMPARG